MKSVQLAAQKVVNDNRRLLSLLQIIGVEQTLVESWLRGDETCVQTFSLGNNAFSLCSPNPAVSHPVGFQSCQIDQLGLLNSLANLFPVHSDLFCTTEPAAT